MTTVAWNRPMGGGAGNPWDTWGMMGAIPLGMPAAAASVPMASVETQPAFKAGTMMGAGGIGMGAGGFTPTGLGFNLPTAQLALSGLSTIGNLWSAFQQNKLAKKAFNFQRDFANTNLRNSTQSYNTQMEDRINSRAFVQGMSPDQARQYLDRHRLTLPSSAAPQGRG